MTDPNHRFVPRRTGPSGDAGGFEGAQIGFAPAARDLAAFGPLARFVADAAVTDIFVNGDDGVWVDRGAGAEPMGPIGLDAAELRSLAVGLIAAGGRHVDESSPCVDVRLGGGMRVHAVLPPISSRGPLLSVRIPRREPLDLEALDTAGFFAAVPIDTVADLVDRRANVLISGAGGSGKTTLLAALLTAASPADRIVTIEDVAELRIRHPHVVSLESRQANLEGAGEVGLTALVREALRMRPDRLVLGECRGAEVREVLAALNTGHDGGAGTLHANSLADVPARLEALGAVAGMSPDAIARQAVSAIGAVLHIVRREGVRTLAQVGRLALDAGQRLTVVEH